MWLIFAIFSAIFASIMQILVKRCLTNLDPIVATFWRNAIVFILGFGLLFYQKTGSKVFSVSKKDVVLLIITGIATFLAYLCFFLAMKDGSVKAVVAVDKLSIVLVFIMSVIIFHEKLSFLSAVGVILMMIGIFLIIYN